MLFGKNVLRFFYSRYKITMNVVTKIVIQHLP